MIAIAQPVVAGEEIAAVNRVLHSGMIAQGPEVAALEEEFASICGTKYAVAVNSGTAAIHCALHAAGVGPGDEVITTPFTFIATINPILMCGARPVLVDIRDNDFLIDPDLVASAITSKTKAVLAVDLYGQPVDYKQLGAMCGRRDIALIEDACQAIGARFGQRATGSLGLAGCFSLYATKNVMSGEGGMLTTNDLAVAESARRFRQHGMTASYEYVELGYNYRMTDVLAAIGRAQIAKLDKFTLARRTTARRFDKGLAGLTGIVLPSTEAGRSHVYHQYTIRITPDFNLSRAELVAALKARGVGTGVYYPKPLHHYPHVAALGYEHDQFPHAVRAAAEVLSLPVHPGVSASDANLIIESIRELANA